MTHRTTAHYQSYPRIYDTQCAIKKENSVDSDTFLRSRQRRQYLDSIRRITTTHLHEHNQSNASTSHATTSTRPALAAEACGTLTPAVLSTLSADSTALPACKVSAVFKELPMT